MMSTTTELTTVYDCGGGNKEYVFCCKGRPFTSMVSETKPSMTLIDYDLVRDLKLKISDLQCSKFTFAGRTLRVFGTVCQVVQTIQNGFTSGNFQIKAKVVLDLYKTFDTFSLASPGMIKQLSGSKSPPSPEPTTSSRAATTPSPSPRHSPPSKRSRASPSAPAPETPPRATTPSTSKQSRATPSAQAPSSPSQPSPSAPTPSSSPPSLSSVKLSSPRSPPGYPTPAFMRMTVRDLPRCMSVKADQLNVSKKKPPFIINTRYLDNVFAGADKLSGKDELHAITAALPDGKLSKFGDDQFLVQTPGGLRYISGHGRHKCSRDCYQLCGGGGAQGVPHNCGFHRQWIFPVGFKPCGSTCRGAFCVCHNQEQGIADQENNDEEKIKCDDIFNLGPYCNFLTIN